MGYRAIALSQVDGAGGELVGRDLAQKLGFGYLNEAIVAQVAKDHGVDQAVVAGAERRKSFFTRVAEMAARGAVDVPLDPSLVRGSHGVPAPALEDMPILIGDGPEPGAQRLAMTEVHPLLIEVLVPDSGRAGLS